MRKIIAALLALPLLYGSFSFGHGEDQEGPHKGFIRMPGAFHTELVPEGKNKLDVYLLDLQWKNPSVKKSNLIILLNDKTEAKCKVKRNFYECTFPKTIDLAKKGILKVTAVREEQKGMEVTYPLPLRLEVVDDGHGGHH